MAQVSGGSGPFPLRMDQIRIRDLFDGSVESKSTSTLLIDTGDGFKDRFNGSGFQYDSANRPIAGTVTNVQETYNGSLVFDISGISIAATQFVAWAQSGDDFGAQATIFAGNDQMSGSTLDDLLLGYDGNDVIAGGEGNDSISGGTGHDNLFGGAGSDQIAGFDGNDHIYGQSASGGADGSDFLDGGEGADYIQGNAGNDTLLGGAGSDRINGGADDDRILGGDGNDTVNGNRGNDTIDGGDGNDSLRGGQGDDSISGGSGDSTILGDLGNDTIVAGSGFDSLTGGAGSDLFVFAGNASISRGLLDVVTDFQSGADRLSLGFSATSLLTGSASDFVSARAAAQALIDGHAGGNEVAAIRVGGETWVMWSTGGGGTIDSGARLLATSSVALSDFI